MSKTKKINIIIIALVIVFSLIYFLPQLLSPQFNLIDDGYSLQIAHDLVDNPQNFWQILVGKEAALGRMRPLYYIYYFVLYLIAGTNPLVFWFGQAVSLGITVYLVYLIINYFTKKPVFSALTSLPIFVLPSVVGNFLRLGPAETRQMIWVLWGFLAFLKFLDKKTHKHREIILLFLLWLTPIFIKETSFIFLGLYGVMLALLAWSKKRKKSWVFSGASLLLTIAIILILPKGEIGYASALSFDLASVKNNFFMVRFSLPEFWWLFMVASMLWVLNLIKNKPFSKKQIPLKLIKYLTIFLAALGNLVLPLFWPYQLVRYYYPAHIFVLIFLAIQAHQAYTLYSFKNKNDKQYLFGATTLIVIASLFIFVPSTLKPKNIFNRYLAKRKIWYEQYQYGGALASYLLDNDFNNYHVIVTYDNYEIIYEIGLYAAHFDFDKSKLTLLSENQMVVDDFGAPFISTENAEETFLSLETPAIIISRENLAKENIILWPTDALLDDPKQVWSVRENNL